MLLRIVVLMTVAATLLVRAQSPQFGTPPKVRLPDESAGIDGIARSLVSAFDQVDIVALGEAHGRRLDSDLRIALVRQPTSIGVHRKITFPAWARTSASQGFWKSIIPVELSW